jgi:hypothetical protein
MTMNHADTPKQQPERLDERLQRLADSLLKKRDEAIEGRAASGIERRWREDQAVFEGRDGIIKTDMVDYATGEAWITSKDRHQPARRSTVVVNIVRGKCETAEGRFTEILLPTDDRNWGIKPTPVAEGAVVEEMKAAMNVPQGAGLLASPMPQAQPQPGEMPQMAPGQAMPQQMPAVPPEPPKDAVVAEMKRRQDDAKKRASLMQDEIDDQLEQCAFNGECRKVVRQAVRLGTGVLRGPNVVKDVSKAWVEQKDETGSAWIMKIKESMNPASSWRDIWNIFPDPNCGSDPKRGSYIWEREYTLAREVQALLGVKGYQNAQLLRVLQEAPKRTTVASPKDQGQGDLRSTTILTARGAPYEKWIYNGDVEKEDLEAMGCTCPEGVGFMFSAQVVFINDIPVKVQLNTLDTGELPYDFFQWVQLDNDSPWGIGEPRKIIWQQRIITAAWRAMMDNAGDSAGAMIAMNKDMQPEDGIWEITGKKLWVDEGDEGGDVRAKFTQFQIVNNQEQLERVIDLALRFTDLESGTPALAQGEKGSSPETLGGMQLLMNGADTGRRRQVKQWDDQVTRPHIGRYYHWNMQYNKRNEIKGDYEVDARGTSVLLVKDETAKMLLQLLQLKADPEVELRVDWSEAIRQLLQALHLDVMKTDDEYEAEKKRRAEMPPPAPPQIEVAKINTEARSKDLQTKLQADAQSQDKDQQLELVLAQVQEHIKAMELQGKKEINFDQLKAMLSSTSMKLTTQQDLSLASDIKDLHKHHTPVQAPVMTPPTEPVGRAEPGQAFAQ